MALNRLAAKHQAGFERATGAGHRSFASLPLGLVVTPDRLQPSRVNRITRILLVVVTVLVLIQLVPYGREHPNPPVTGEPSWDRPKTKALFERACGDCHSHKTKWPWYANIAPASWLVTHDVLEGREHFNVSAWGAQKRNEGEDAAEELEEGEMPLVIYVPLHPEARLSADEREQLIAGLRATFGEASPDHGSDEHLQP